MTDSSTNQDEWYTFDCDGHQFTVPIRYQDPVRIGEGASGVVIRATDTVTGKNVAIKKLRHPFLSQILAKQTCRALKLSMYLNHPDAQVVQLYNVFTPERSLNEFKTLYFVFNYADFNLHQAIRPHRPFIEYHIRLIIYSLLRTLKFIHSAGIIHCDLRPSKIGIDRELNITILDYGLAHVLSDDSDYTSDGARWWRAPEMYITDGQYRDKIDVWSVGCIMAELILLRTVFRGTDYLDQLNKTLDILGTPDTATLNEIYTTVLDVVAYIGRLPPRPKQDFNQLFGFKYDAATQTPISGVSSKGVDLLGRLLSFDHRIRPTAAEALAHPFFEDFHDPTDEPDIEPLIDEHHDANHSVEMWKSLVWQLIEEFQPPSWINDDLDEDSSDAPEAT